MKKFRGLWKYISGRSPKILKRQDFFFMTGFARHLHGGAVGDDTRLLLTEVFLMLRSCD